MNELNDYVEDACKDMEDPIQNGSNYELKFEQEGCQNAVDADGSMVLDPMDHDIVDYGVGMWISQVYYHGNNTADRRDFATTHEDEAGAFFSPLENGEYLPTARNYFGYGGYGNANQNGQNGGGNNNNGGAR